MRYFLDQEFIEGFRKPLFGKRQHFIDLISIGIVAEDGREYSAICSEFNYKEASPWVKDNVIEPLYNATIHGYLRPSNPIEGFHKIYGKSRKQIAQDIISFLNPVTCFAGYMLDNKDVVERQLTTSERMKDEFMKHNVGLIDGRYYVRPEIYGYYSDYDWVLFCSLFGTMMDLPKGFPMYCVDLKQTLDERAGKLAFMANITFDAALERIQEYKKYPRNGNEHNALSDARFIKQLAQFLQKT